MLISDGPTLLIDVTRDLAVQAEPLTRIDAVALTHAHRDAIGGLPALRRGGVRTAPRVRSTSSSARRPPTSSARATGASSTADCASQLPETFATQGRSP